MIDALKTFTSLGLAASEAKVYLAALKLGPNSVQNIAKEAKLSRTAAYEAIRILTDHGLMSSFVRGKKRLFSSEDPDNTVAHFKKRVMNMQEELSGLERSLPELKMMAHGERPTVRFYEGEEAVHAVFADMTQVAPSTLDEVSNLDDLYKVMDMKMIHAARKAFDSTRARTKTRLLHRGELKTQPRLNCEYCQLPDAFGDFRGDILLYANRVVFVSFLGKVISVVIESQTLTDTARVLFEAAWRICAMPKK